MLLTHEVECSVCNDKFQAYEITCAPCGHNYCNGCMRAFILRGCRDEGLFPPRCCRQEIPLKSVANLLSADDMDTFRSAQTEFSTQDRTYCSTLDCGVFIPPTRIEADRACCGKCGGIT